ncbi:MAG: fructose-bisphosphatase class III, partial [Ruminococcus sp.]|nr:fructose-bisphosphatase class III [Ruminococcus sp.]
MIYITYVMSDLHGAYERYERMLRLIDFSDNDTLFVLGDIVDRGENPAGILLDMMNRNNVYPLMGNHDCMAMYFLEMLSSEMAEHDFSRHMSEDDSLDFACWLSGGGKTTFDSLCQLTTAERADILRYMQEFPLYEIVNLNGRTFFLVHAGLGGF